MLAFRGGVVKIDEKRLRTDFVQNRPRVTWEHIFQGNEVRFCLS